VHTPSTADVHRTIREYNTKRPSGAPATVVGENGQMVDAKSGRPVRCTLPFKPDRIRPGCCR
jgi:hypothetical protein